MEIKVENYRIARLFGWAAFLISLVSKNQWLMVTGLILLFYGLFIPRIKKFYYKKKNKLYIKVIIQEFYNEYCMLSEECLRKEEISKDLETLIKTNIEHAPNISDPFELLKHISKGLQKTMKVVSPNKYMKQIKNLNALKVEATRSLLDYKYFDELKIGIF